MANLENALQQIREERKQAQLRMQQLDEVIRGLVGLNSLAPSRSRTLSASAREGCSDRAKRRA
jgi:hypothetical protein